MSPNQVYEFQKITTEEKVDFFVMCQDLLIKYHPDSEFIITKRNLQNKKKWVETFFFKYKGFVYYNNYVCILFNRVHIEDTKNPIKALKDHLYQAPKENFNALSIDFAAFRDLSDCIGFCNSQYTPNLENILFVKNNQIKIYPTSKLIQRLGSVSPKI